MNNKPDFAAMTANDLRAYVLEHRDDEEALHCLIDKLHAGRASTSRIYSPEEDVTVVLAERLQAKRQN